MPLIKPPNRSRPWILAVGLIIAGFAGVAFVWPRATDRYHGWRAAHHLRMASEFFSRGDSSHAILSAQNALAHRPDDADATRIILKSLEALGAPQAEQWRAKLEKLRPADPDALLARARSALKAGYVGMAEQTLSSAEPADRNRGDYHAVMADIAMEKRDVAAAESHWIEASRSEPGVKGHVLNLAKVRLESPKPAVRSLALDTLQDLRKEPSARIEATRLLLADAIRHSEEERARELADALVAEPGAAFTDKLSRLNTLRVFKDARSGPYLLELRDAVLGEPADLFALLTWMNAKNLSLMVVEWVPSMRSSSLTTTPECLAIADAYLRVGEWEKLEKIAGTGSWGEWEYLRRAFFAQALERLGDDEESAKEWGMAVGLARGHPDAQERLVRFANHAKWDKRAEEIMWALVTAPACPRWIFDALWKPAEQRGETARLHKLSSILVKMDPKGVATRNNYAFFSLLTRNDEGNPHAIAETLHRENPDNAAVASTYGLSLLQRGRADEAVALMSRMKPDDLRQPQIAFYFAMFLISTGQKEQAETYLKLSAGSPMLPEEKALLDRVKLASLPEAAILRPTVRAAPADEQR